MIYTLTLNPAMDITIITEEIRKEHINITDIRSISAGGKGFNVSRALNCLGLSNTAIAFCGGFFCHSIKNIMEEEKIKSELIPIKESIRANIKIIEEKSKKVVEFNERGPHISEEESAMMIDTLKRTEKDADYFIISGSLPRNMDDKIYRRIIDILKGRNIKTLLDASGAALYHGIEAIPDIVKINREEMAQLCDRHKKDQDVLAGTIIKEGMKIIMVTDGPNDTIYYDNSGKYRIKSPQIKGSYKTGAGDSVNAGLVYSIIKSFSIKDRLRFCIACGNANILNEVPGRIDMDKVKELSLRVKVEKEGDL